MIEESGKVVAVQGDFAWIESERTTACGGCAVRTGCGTSAIAKMFGQRRLRLRVLNRINAHVGDTVVVGISESGLVRGSLAVYAAPLAGLFAGAFAGHFAGNQLLANGFGSHGGWWSVDRVSGSAVLAAALQPDNGKGCCLAAGGAATAHQYWQ